MKYFSAGNVALGSLLIVLRKLEVCLRYSPSEEAHLRISGRFLLRKEYTVNWLYAFEAQ